jgi:hypothetical protein
MRNLVYRRIFSPARAARSASSSPPDEDLEFVEDTGDGRLVETAISLTEKRTRITVHNHYHDDEQHTC